MTAEDERDILREAERLADRIITWGTGLRAAWLVGGAAAVAAYLEGDAAQDIDSTGRLVFGAMNLLTAVREADDFAADGAAETAREEVVA